MKFEPADLFSLAFDKHDSSTVVARVGFLSHEAPGNVGATSITVETRLALSPGESMETIRTSAIRAAMALLAIDFAPRPTGPPDEPTGS